MSSLLWLLLLPLLVQADTILRLSKHSSSHSNHTPLKRASPYPGYAEAAFDTHQTWYKDGKWNTAGWWNWANCLTVCADLQAVDNARKDPISKLFSEVYSHNKDQKFLNDFYDDEGWWALAWIAVYDVTQDTKYLDAAHTIFADMDHGWKGTCHGGGMWWNKKPDKKGEHFIAAISNELYISVAASLANRVKTGGASYTVKAVHAWLWLKDSGMMNATGLFNDGLDQKSCANNGHNGWTYNQGVILGGLVELSRATGGEKKLLGAATAIADAALKQNPGPILREACEPNCRDGNAQQFKGAFIRNLAKLYGATGKKEYRDFITSNADSIWANNRERKGKGEEENRMGQSWSVFVPAPNVVTHNSAFAGLVAAAAVTK